MLCFTILVHLIVDFLAGSTWTCSDFLAGSTCSARWSSQEIGSHRKLEKFVDLYCYWHLDHSKKYRMLVAPASSIITDIRCRNRLAQAIIHFNYSLDVLTVNPTMDILPSLHWTFHLLWNISLLLPSLPHCTLRKISTIFRCVPCNCFPNLWLQQPLSLRISSKCTDRCLELGAWLAATWSMASKRN